MHTRWETNVTSYKLLKSKYDEWIDDEKRLKELLRESKVGLYKFRDKGIWEFLKSYHADPGFWKKQDNESWIACRDRLSKECYGLGYAKTAFALEMCYPNQCESVCMDTHMIQLYGYAPSDVAKVNHGSKYKDLELHWSDYCKQKQVPSFIARAVFWDVKQKKRSSRYWSACLEHEQTKSTHPDTNQPRQHQCSGETIPRVLEEANNG